MSDTANLSQLLKKLAGPLTEPVASALISQLAPSTGRVDVCAINPDFLVRQKARLLPR